MIDFKKYGGKQRIIDVTDPVRLFQALDVKTSHTTLRPAQLEALQAVGARRAERDLVLKMNTGAGKTGVALLYLRSYAAEKRRPAIYLCSTTQLVAQVLEEAANLGIAAVEYRAGEPHPDPRGMSGDAVIVCTYEKLFNARTTFDRTDVRLSPCAMVLDDAHAGVERVRDAFTIRISAGEYHRKLIGLLRAPMKAYNAGPWSDIERGNDAAIEEVPYWIWNPLVDEVRSLLAQHADDEFKFVWNHVRDQLSAFRCIVSATAIEIVPDIIAVERVRAYHEAEHRLFTSATLADDSVLVRELGCAAEAAGLPIIPASDQGVGERMVLAPSLIDPRLDRSWVMKWCARLSKRVTVVVLAPTMKMANDWLPHGASAVSGDDVGNAVDQLKSGALHFVVFANRYDGIDLPDAGCRVLVLDGMPYGESLTARHDADTPGRPGTAHNRLVHRIEQGMGRAVRSHADYAVVVLAGPELAHFVSRLDILDAFNPSTRAQIEFVHDLTAIGRKEHPGEPQKAANDLVWACLDRSESWKDLYEEKVRGAVSAASTPSADAIALAKAEREAANWALRRDPTRAADTIEAVLSAHAKGERQKGWYLQSAARYRFAVDPARAFQMQAAANEKNNRMFLPPTGTSARPEKADRDDAPVAILRWYGGFANVNGAIAAFHEVRARLSFDVSAETMEQALMDLAIFFGAHATRPEKTAHAGPDDLWLWPDMAAVLEVKNEARYTKIPKKDSGQLHDSLEWFAESYPTRAAVPIFVARASQSERNAHCPDGTRVLMPDGLDALLGNLERFLAELVTRPAAQWTPAAVGQLLVRHKLTASHIISNYPAPLK